MKSKVTTPRPLFPKPVRRFPLALKLSPKARKCIFHQGSIKQFAKQSNANELMSTSQTLEKYFSSPFRLADFKQEEGMEMLAAVEREMQRGSRNIAKFSPQIPRPKNPLGKLFAAGLDQFSLGMKSCMRESLESLATEGSFKGCRV
eukprot:TRINITY_DN8474_c0_g5_i4.p1 TRINITY_DN8474_c0_g5~~TRINITY_DN8474_c0_g5_i4.p1  ORF type:complete len:146 (-),score=12.17 TRINITY_DN8474_c0_g5_i4:141-578(-)